MAQADGHILIDTKIDTSGIESGLSSASKLAIGAAGAITAALGAAAAAAIKVGSDFYAGMSEVQAISGATGDDLVALTEKAKEMGATTKFSASESAEALKYMAMAGWNADQMIAGLPGVMNLAAASGEALGTVSDIVTDALTAMGLKAGDAAHFADVLAMASSSSNTNVGLMGETFKYVAPLAGALGFSIEDTSVAIGLMANAGIKGSQAGTSLRSILTRLAHPTKQSAEAMADLGIEITNADGSMRPLNDILLDMRDGFSSLTEAEKATYAAMLGGQEAMSGLLSIVNASDEDFQNMTAAIADADGAAERMAKTMQDNLAGDLEELGGALETVQIQIFEAFNDPLRKAAQAAQGAIGQISDELASPKMQAALGTIGDGFTSIVETIAGFAADAIPKAVSAIAWVVEHFDELTRVVGIAGAAFVGFKAAASVSKALSAVSAASQAATAANTTLSIAMNAASVAASKSNTTISLYQAAVGLFTGKLQGATVKQIAMNAAMKAAPALAVAGMAATVAAAAALSNALHDTTDAAKALTKETNALLDASRDLLNAGHETSQAYFEQGEVLRENAQKTRALMGELAALGSTVGLTAEQQERQRGIVQELNALYPDLNLELDKQSGALNKTTEELQALIEAEIARAELAAAEKRYSEIREEQRENTAKLAELEEQRTATLHAQAEAQERVNTLSAVFNPIQYSQANNDLDEHTRKLRDLDTEIDILVINQERLGNAAVRASEDIAAATEQEETATATAAASLEQKAKALQSINDKYDPLIDKTGDVIDATNDFIETLEGETEAFQASQAAIDAEAGLLKDLADQTASLASIKNRTADEDARLAANMQILNSLIPSLNLAFDEQGNSLNRTAEEITAYAEAQAAHLKQTDAEERLVEIFRQQADVTKARTEAQRELAEVEAGMAGILEEINALCDEHGTVLQGNQEQVALLTEKYGEQSTQAEALRVGIATLTAQESEYGENAQQLAGDIAGSQEIINEARMNGILVTEEALKAEEAVQKAREKLAEETAANIKKAEEQLLADMEKAYERYASVTQNALDTVNTKNGVSLKEAQKNLQENQRTMETWFANLETIAARGASTDFLAWLRGLGPEQSKLISQLATASDADFAKLQSSWENGAKIAVDEVKNEFEIGEPGVSAAAKAIVDAVVLGFADNPEMEAAAKKLIDKALFGANTGVTEQAGALKQVGTDIDAKMAESLPEATATEDAAKALVGRTKTAAGDEVTAQNFPDTGKQIDTDTAQGVTDNINLVEDAAKTVVGNTLTAALIQVSASGFTQVGYQMDQGMAAGLYSGQNLVTSAAASVALAAYEAAKAALGIASPSKLFRELGDWSVEGLVEPFTSRAADAARAVAAFMDNLYQAAERQAMGTFGVQAASPTAATGGDSYYSFGDVTIQTERMDDPKDFVEAMEDMAYEYNRQARYKGAMTHGRTTG